MLSIIAAIDKRGIISKNGKLPWKCQEDLLFFKEKTLRHPIIMGRATFESLNCKPLPKRFNIVITRDFNLWNKSHGSDILKFVSHPCASVLTALDLPEKYDDPTDEAFVIGGEKIYKWFMSSESTNRIYLNEIKTNVEYKPKDRVLFFPKISDKVWNLVEKKDHGDFESNIYEKKQSCINKE